MSRCFSRVAAAVALLTIVACSDKTPKKMALRPPPPVTRQSAGVAVEAPPPAAFPKTTEVTFQSHGHTLYGYITKPHGPGAFPAILYNHGSEQKGGQKEDLRKYFVDHGFVFFIPHRSGHGKSGGTYYADRLKKGARGDKSRAEIRIHEEQADDVSAALALLKTFPYVNKSKLVVGGCSFGGIQTMLAVERDQGIRAVLDFAGGAMSWTANQPLHGRLKRAVDNAKAPIFFIQAQNDFNLGPTHELAAEAVRAHKVHKAKIFPPNGTTHEDGHGGFCMHQPNIWGPDVLAWLKLYI